MPEPDFHWIPYGPSAALYRFSNSSASLGQLQKIISRLEENSPPNLSEYIPGLSTLLLVFKTSRELPLSEQADDLAKWMIKISGDTPANSTLHEIPVCYNGPDLKSVAAGHGLSEEAVVSIHSGSLYSVQMLGFSPGFPYLGPLDPRLHTPRLANPRSRIAPGSVAIGGPHTGIYTVKSAGGWHLLGSTRVKIFDPSRATSGMEQAMFLLKPGDQVRFIQTHE